MPALLNVDRRTENAARRLVKSLIDASKYRGRDEVIRRSFVKLADRVPQTLDDPDYARILFRAKADELEEVLGDSEKARIVKMRVNYGVEGSSGPLWKLLDSYVKVLDEMSRMF